MVLQDPVDGNEPRRVTGVTALKREKVKLVSSFRILDVEKESVL